MNSSLLNYSSVIIFLVVAQSASFSFAETILDEYNKKSSSFVVEPDPLDPLPAKHENIKDGDEIVLDDIKQVLNSKIEDPSQKKTQSEGLTKTTEEKSFTQLENLNSKSDSLSKSKSLTKKNRKKKKLKTLAPDEADVGLENKLHKIYQTYNINPTSEEQWGVVTSQQTMHIYTVQKNDTLFTISQTLFGDSKFWPKIWSLNKTSILNPHQINPGMEIYFYSGTSGSAPVLSLDKNLMTSHEDMAKADKSLEGDKHYRQDTEFNKSLSYQMTKAQKFEDPTAIPESLPLTKNKNYLGLKVPDIEIKLTDNTYIDRSEYANPYILSADQLKSDFSIPLNQAAGAAICRENQFIPIVNKKNLNAVTPGRYLIVDQLYRNKQRIRSTYKYKVIGSVTVNEQNQMRISRCDQLYNTDVIIVSEETLSKLNEPVEKFGTGSIVLDGMEFEDQSYYSTNHYMIINMDGLNADTGAELKVYSDQLGKQVGQIKVIKRTGTLGIAVVTEVSDLISQGDRITE